MFLELTTTICIKPLDRDIHVSGNIEREGAWEKEIVNNVIRAMQSYPGAVFLDMGSNIGMYTVVIAAMKRSVIAVDADPINLAYIRKSLEIENTTDYVETIYNSIRLNLLAVYKKFFSCLSPVSQQSLSCLSGVSQVSLRCLSGVSQVSLRCLSGVSQVFLSSLS